MNPLTVSARFAAFVWFQEQGENASKCAAEAHAFARDNWKQFLPVAHEGWGKLLLKVAGYKRRKKARLDPVAAHSERQGGVSATCELPAKEQASPSFLGYQWAGSDV